MECSCRLWPTPGMYAVTSWPLVSRTRATLRRAEFGFFGVFVYTRVETPRRCGAPRSAGVLVLVVFDCRPLRTSWEMVGTRLLKRNYLGIHHTISTLAPAVLRRPLSPPTAASSDGGARRAKRGPGGGSSRGEGSPPPPKVLPGCLFRACQEAGLVVADPGCDLAVARTDGGQPGGEVLIGVGRVVRQWFVVRRLEIEVAVAGHPRACGDQLADD